MSWHCTTEDSGTGPTQTEGGDGLWYDCSTNCILDKTQNRSQWLVVIIQILQKQASLSTMSCPIWKNVLPLLVKSLHLLSFFPSAPPQHIPFWLVLLLQTGITKSLSCSALENGVILRPCGPVQSQVISFSQWSLTFLSSACNAHFNVQTWLQRITDWRWILPIGTQGHASVVQQRNAEISEPVEMMLALELCRKWSTEKIRHQVEKLSGIDVSSFLFSNNVTGIVQSLSQQNLRGSLYSETPFSKASLRKRLASSKAGFTKVPFGTSGSFLFKRQSPSQK